MKDYQPLSIALYANIDNRAAEDEREFPTGDQLYHGLPFQIGDGKGKMAGFGQSIRMDPAELTVGMKVRTVTFAHRLIDSNFHQGGTPIGETCASYVFAFEDGETEEVAIRERFEIGSIPIPWGHWPLLARPEVQEGLHPRYEGKWSEAGVRQLETTHPWAQFFYLWYWINPNPDKELKKITIVPKGPRFYIAGVTLGFLDEDPLTRSARRPVKVSLLRPEDQQRQGDLDIEVDRGVATYPYSLPRQSQGEFIEDFHRGWGQEMNHTIHPSYVEIAASPSARVTVKHGGEELGAVSWGEVEARGTAISEDRVKIELVDPGRNWVHTTVVDDHTGKPIPCRIHFRSPEGIPYQPHGHHPHVNSNNGTWHIDIGGDVRLGQITYAYIQGECQGWLPRGEVLVDVARGYEYEPLRTQVQIAPGQQELTLRLKRLADMRKDRYFSGDTHVHFISTQGAHLEASAEGVHVVNLLQSQWGHLFTSTEEFTGEPSVSRDGETIVYATQENRQHLLGHLTLLGVKKPIMPWCSGGPDEADLGGNLEATLSRWADDCHKQGGTVIIPHIPTPNGEPAALIATGRADAVEFLIHSEYIHKEYYRYLNCGYRLPLVGGTDKMCSGVPIGLYRTYVHIPADQEFSYDSWCRNLKTGNTFISGGPLLWFQVEGQAMGSTLRLPGGGGTVEVEILARSCLPFHCIELIRNGEVVDRLEESAGTHEMQLKSRVTIDRHSWLAARCSGPGYEAVPHHDSWKRGIMAHTSPVYIAVGEDWWMFSRDTANYMLTLIQGCIDFIHTRSPQWQKGSVTHHHGREDHLAFLEEPFREAIQAIHRRMHSLGIPH